MLLNQFTANVSYCLTPTTGSLTISVSDHETITDNWVNWVECWMHEGAEHDVDIWDIREYELTETHILPPTLWCLGSV